MPAVPQCIRDIDARLGVASDTVTGDLRLLRDLRSLRDAVVESGLPFSIVRWAG